MTTAASPRAGERLRRKHAEHDALVRWLANLERGPLTDLEAAATVRAQLERVVVEIKRMEAAA